MFSLQKDSSHIYSIYSLHTNIKGCFDYKIATEILFYFYMLCVYGWETTMFFDKHDYLEKNRKSVLKIMMASSKQYDTGRNHTCLYGLPKKLLCIVLKSQCSSE